MSSAREVIAEARRGMSDQAEIDAREEYQRLVERVNRATDAEIAADILSSLKGGRS